MPSFTVFKGTSDGTIKESQTTRPDLEGDQVFVRTTCSGLCGTDLHYKSTDMGIGHEGAGVVEAVGPQAKIYKKGDRVGWGYQHNCCGHCQPCLSGRETYCAEREMYGMANTDQGSFSYGSVWREAFLYKLPDNMSDEAAAPLMCGGATVFNALHSYNVQPTDVVGVMGVGGLGHLAIKFASKMGCHVVVLSSSDRKKEEAMQLGAKEFVVTKGVKELKVDRKIKHLLVTTAAQPDWEQLMSIMAPEAIILPLTVAEGNFSIPYMPMLLNGLTIQGSVVAPRGVHQRMLEFAADHQIEPIIEKFPLNEKGIAEAVQKLEAGEMRYRGVLTAPSS